MKRKSDKVVIKFDDFGPCQVDVTLVCTLWNDTWGIYQWDEWDYKKNTLKEIKYRLIKVTRLNTESCDLKVNITATQAHEIIEKLSLEQNQGPFRSSSTWKSKGWFDRHLERFRKQKSKKYATTKTS